MECKFAYLKEKIPYVLCRKEATPTGLDRKELFHAVCMHQAHCPKENCHKLTPAWSTCMKLREIATEKPQERVQAAIDEAVPAEPEAKKVAPRSRKKAKTEE